MTTHKLLQKTTTEGNDSPLTPHASPRVQSREATGLRVDRQEIVATEEEDWTELVDVVIW